MDKLTTHYSLLTITFFLLSMFTLTAQSTVVKRSTEFPKDLTNNFFYQPFVVDGLPFTTSSKPSFIQLQKLDLLPSFFCRVEYKLEAKSKLAPRFRLGSLNYTNWMEGKGELYSRYWK